jgi:phage terminase small subunit
MAGTGSSGRPSVKHQLEVKGDQGLPDKPDGLGEHASSMWDLAIESLPHVIRKVDGPILRLACESYQQAMDMFEAGKTNDALKAAKTFDQLAQKIGLSPSARRVVKPVESKDKGVQSEVSEFELWMKRGRKA